MFIFICLVGLVESLAGGLTGNISLATLGMATMTLGMVVKLGEDVESVLNNRGRNGFD